MNKDEYEEQTDCADWEFFVVRFLWTVLIVFAFVCWGVVIAWLL